MYAYMCIRTCVLTHTHLSIYIFIYVSECVDVWRVSVCVFLGVCVWACVCRTLKRKHMHTHAHTNARTQTHSRFSSAVLHSSMQQLVAKYRGQAPQMRTWPGPLEAEHKMHEFIRRTIDDIAESTRVPAVDVWHTLLALCEHHWRSDCDGLLGVIGMCVWCCIIHICVCIYIYVYLFIIHLWAHVYIYMYMYVFYIYIHI